MKIILLLVVIYFASANGQGSALCKENEIENYCYSPCEKTCRTRFRSDGRLCLDVCRNGCSCIGGYLRHDNGTCVPVDQCSEPLCNIDEDYKECGQIEEETCQNMGSTCLSLACKPGCYCKENRVRWTSSNNACVHSSECPTRTCSGVNEEFSECPKQCPPQTCDALFNTYKCGNAEDECCDPKCMCKDGFWRNAEGVCVSTEQCVEDYYNKD